MAGSAMGIKDACEVHLKNLETGEIIYIPYFNKFSIDLKGSEVFANKKGQRAITWDKALEGSFTGDLEVLNSQIMALMLGVGLVKTNTDIFKKEVLTTTVADTVTLADTPKVGSLTVMIPDDDGVVATKVFTVVSGTPTAGQVKLATSTLTFASGEAVIGTKLFITYLVAKTDMNKFTVYGNGSSSNYSLFANVECKLESTGATEYRQICLPKIAIKKEMKLDFDAENPSKFSISGNMLADSNDVMLTWTEL